ncbi:MAG: Mbeg1-like protein [Psychrilyobacter sp.]|uniref:Mbeg1-like protein n=1 Tax=Psychrilyobacter sp. TaxID=2586924 RepID=UPI003C71998E
MITELDYLVLSGLSYGDFKEEDIGYSLEEILFLNSESKKRLLSFPNEVWSYGGSEIFEKTFHTFLCEWKVIGIMDDTYKQGIEKTGFYAIAFEKNKQVVISYRGTELSSFGEAYKDFIETDLLISVDKKPKQLEQGVEFYKEILKMNYESIALTGHSLGGGIAQYVALISDLKECGIPKVYTWNALGINKAGILSLEDFLEFDSIAERKYPSLKNNEILYKRVKAYYYSYLFKTLKKNNYIKDKESIKKISKLEFKLELDEDAEKKLENIFTISNKSMLPFFSKTEEEKNELIMSPKVFIEDFFDENMIYEELTRARKFIKKFKNNNKYDEYIINFVHSEDFTITLYPHLGSTYAINKGLVKSEEKLPPLLKKMYAFTKSMRSYHMYQVFLPFFSFEGEDRGHIKKELSIDYIATEVRRVIYQEKDLTDEFLGFYYNGLELDSDNYYKIKKTLLHGMGMTKADIKYLKEAIIMIKRMDFAKFRELWKKVKKKVGSPYVKKDVYDLISFNKRHK